jgi:hypothetical protein
LANKYSLALFGSETNTGDQAPLPRSTPTCLAREHDTIINTNMPFNPREHKLHMRSQAWMKRRARYYRMVVPHMPDNMFNADGRQLKDRYEDLYNRLCKLLALLQHYVPLVWDQMYEGKVSWGEYLPVADTLHARLTPITDLLKKLYDAGTRGAYSEDCDGYTPVKIMSNRATPLPPTFKQWIVLQREMGRHPPPDAIEHMENVVREMNAEVPVKPLYTVQLYSMLAEVMAKYVEAAAFDEPMRFLIVNNLLGGPLPMAHPGFPDPLWMAHQLQDLLDDVRCYCREK